jgi:3-deoxy-D-manno-octulosonic-acid transferase
LYWRGKKSPDYRLRWQERLGLYADKAVKKNVIWVHAVSVGEVEAAIPLIKQIQKQYSHQQILVTTTTPTGSKRVSTILGASVEHVYLPYDLPIILQRFFARYQPKVALIMEKEMWPNLFCACGDKNIPLFIINARLSTRSSRSYQKIPSLVATTLAPVTKILAQTTEDSLNFISIGATREQLMVSGNLKFDMTISLETIESGQQLKNKLFSQRFVWLVGSTHKGEDELFITAYKALKKTIPELLLILVPRHPERFLAVKQLVERDASLTVQMRSDELAICSRNVDVYIADTIGELKMLYSTADISFMGGTMIPVGGHNILEPLAVGVLVIFGPYMDNFKEISEQVIKIDAAIQIHSVNELIETLEFVYTHEQYRKSVIKNGYLFLSENKGAKNFTFNEIKNILSPLHETRNS